MRTSRLLLGGLLLGGTYLMLAGRKKRVVRQVHEEKLLDKALKETFPASDATATQDYSIPVNVPR